MLWFIWIFFAVGVTVTIVGALYAISGIILNHMARKEEEKIKKEYQKNEIWLGTWGA